MLDQFFGRISNAANKFHILLKSIFVAHSIGIFEIPALRLANNETLKYAQVFLTFQRIIVVTIIVNRSNNNSQNKSSKRCKRNYPVTEFFGNSRKADIEDGVRIPCAAVSAFIASSEFTRIPARGARIPWKAGDR